MHVCYTWWYTGHHILQLTLQTLHLVRFCYRCFLGSNAGPAQWPDCNRYVEAVMTKLFDIYQSPVQSQGTRTQRWSLVMQAYKHIREKVLSNARVMAATQLQLVEVNQTTYSVVRSIYTTITFFISFSFLLIFSVLAVAVTILLTMLLNNIWNGQVFCEKCNFYTLYSYF